MRKPFLTIQPVSIATALSLVLLGCGSTGALSPGPADLGASATPDLTTAIPDLAAPSVDLSHTTDLALPPPDLAGFCGNPNSPRINLNGMQANSPAVSASQIILNCCDAAEFQVYSMQINTPIFVMWRHGVGMGPNPPVTLDLAKLPTGWYVAVYSGCDPTQPNCKPTDMMDTGLSGSLTISGNFSGYDMSICLTAKDSMQNPHPVIHNLAFWSPTITAK